jgi:hypothetical protein
MATVTLSAIHCKLLKAYTVLANSAVSHAITGTLLETTLATIVVPPARMGPNGILRVTSLWSFTVNANLKTLRVSFGGIVFSELQPSATNASFSIETVIRNRNNSGLQIANAIGSAGSGLATTAPITTAINTGAQQNLALTGILANVADTITLESYRVDLYYGA